MENDISKCNNENCPKKKDCYRYTVKPDIMQSYLVDVKPDKNGECKHFWQLGDGRFDTDEI